MCAWVVPDEDVKKSSTRSAPMPCSRSCSVLLTYSPVALTLLCLLAEFSNPNQKH